MRTFLDSDHVVKVEPKGWLESEHWRDVHKILGSIGFTWFFNSKVRSWIRFNRSSVPRRTSVVNHAPLL